MTFLESLGSPADLRALDAAECAELAAEIREFLVTTMSGTGGHLGSNLGIVELTMGIHRVFDSPHDTIVFDVGHQSYVHKILTGRREEFATLRQRGGLSGYPNRAESVHDVLENSHASAALSWADGIAKARQLGGESDRHVVAVIGDGALTGGLAWEALNRIAADRSTPPRRLIVIVNDNGRSYAPTIGGLAAHLGTDDRRGSDTTQPDAEGGLGRPSVIAGAEADMGAGRWFEIAPTEAEFGERFGLAYMGLVDGHDLPAVEEALRRARDADSGPVIVHMRTQKGRGYSPAVNDETDHLHSVGAMDPTTGRPVPTGTNAATGTTVATGRQAAAGTSAAEPTSTSPTWTNVFGTEIWALAAERTDIVAITAAMLVPVGLDRFAAEFPERVIDVGIAEQHAVAVAAGLSSGGLHPVVCLYSTFLSRAFDQVLMDVALHRQGVTFVLDRAGITGPDGPSHHGTWDIALLSLVPGLRLAAPRDADRLAEELREAVAIDDGPTVVRFPRGKIGPDIAALRRLDDDGIDILHEAPGGGPPEILIISVGALAALSVAVAERLAEFGLTTTVIDPRWVLPLPESIIDLAADHRLVAVIEDGMKTGGIGSQIRSKLQDSQVRKSVLSFGTPDEFLTHGTREEILAEVGLETASIVTEILANVPAEAADRADMSSRHPE